MFLNKNSLLISLSLLFTFLVSGCSTTQQVPPESLSLSQARYGHATVSNGENLYVIAGSHGSKFLSDIEIINPKTGAKKVLKDILIPRRYFSAVWDGKHSIYIIGGISAEDEIIRYERKVEVFNTKTHQITFAESLPYPTRTNTAVYFNDKIFVFGGSYPSKRRKSSEPTAIVSVLNITKNRWKRMKKMPTAKSTKAVVKDGFIYTVGGFDSKLATDTFDRFDPVLKKWQSMPRLPAKISAHSVTLLDNKLFVFGDYKEITATYSYDFDTKLWEKINIGYKASRHNAATTIDDTMYVTGGNTGSSGPYHDYIQVFKLDK